jgi:hypothetical protein
VSAIQGNTGEIHELARYEVRPEALEQCLAAIHEPRRSRNACFSFA